MREDLELGRGRVPIGRASLSEESHCQWRSTDNTNTFGLEIGHCVLQGGVIDTVMAIGKDHIQCSRRNPIQHIGKYSQRKSRDPNESSLPRFLQFLECRNRFINNLHWKEERHTWHKEANITTAQNQLRRLFCYSFCYYSVMTAVVPDLRSQIQYHGIGECRHSRAATFPSSHLCFSSLSLHWNQSHPCSDRTWLPLCIHFSARSGLSTPFPALFLTVSLRNTFNFFSKKYIYIYEKTENENERKGNGIGLECVRRSVEEVDAGLEGEANRSIGLFLGNRTEDVAKRWCSEPHAAQLQSGSPKLP